jgi:translation initiation factor 2 subunit 1
MVHSPTKFPEIGEFVVAKVETVNPTYAYVNLEDYEGNTPGGRARGMVHVGEIASHWVRNIHDFIKENQRVVLKVLRTDEVKGHIDLSLRRVSPQQKKEKLKTWKRAVKAENILQIIGEHVEKSLDEMFEAWGFQLWREYGGDILTAFEEIKEEGPNTIVQWDTVPEEWRQFIFDIIDQNVEIPYVSITAEMKVSSLSPTGVQDVKEALLAGLNVEHEKGVKVSMHVIGAPRYKLDIVAKDYQDAEDLYGQIQRAVEGSMKKCHGEVAFTRS